MAKKGVSAEEKLRRVADFFMAKPEVYTIKELEKKIPKACGVPAMTVGDLIKSVVDENMVRCEKLGQLNVYWRFPKEEQHYHSCEIEKLRLGIDGYAEDRDRKRAHLEKLAGERSNTVERQQLQQLYTALRAKKDAMDRAKWLEENCSVRAYNEMGKEMAECKAQINKATDDVFTLRSFVCGKYGLDKKEFDSSFGIGELDYVD